MGLTSKALEKAHGSVITTSQPAPSWSDAKAKHSRNMSSLWHKYKVSEEEYQDMMNEQKGCCLICQTDFGTTEKRACLDHDHYTGVPRGLLCTQCNTRIGWLEKNIYRLLPYLQQR